ncbi:MAG: right-handed parallel beta-helix repeat-containing protein, partial [Candidatus Brocadiia bacterium]
MAQPTTRRRSSARSTATDDTAAIQRALDEAADVRGTVTFAPGTYLCSTLKVPSHVGLAAHPMWSYRGFGGAILRLADERAPCLLDVTGAIGARADGLCLDGGDLGDCIHGILLDRPRPGSKEDTLHVENCRIAGFSGDGIRLGLVWLFTVRHCMVGHNGGCGLWVHGCDGFILDNWFSGNGGAGFGAYDGSASITMTGNRVEWNRAGGVVVHGGSRYNITGNYVDRSGGPGLVLLPGKEDQGNQTFAVTGNLFWRSGKPEWTDPDGYESCHVRLNHVRGMTFVGNTLQAGQD